MIRLKSIRSKLLFGIMVPLSLILTVSFFIEYRMTVLKAYMEVKERSLNIARMATHIVETDFANTDFVRLQQNLNEIGLQEKLNYLYVIDQNKLFVGHYPERERIKTPYTGEIPVSVDTIKKYLKSEIQYILPITNRLDGRMGYLFVSYPLSRFLEQKREMFLSRLGIMIVVFLSIFVFVKKISQKITDPIIELKNVSDQVTGGNLEIEAKDIETGDETQVLAQAFNQMIAEIRAFKKKILQEQQDLVEQNRILSLELNKHDKFNMIGNSNAIMKVRELIEKSSQSDVSVLITGETGCGKELVAREIHENSGRKYKPFIAVNCGAINLNLIEAELFGAEKGAYTGALQRRIGKFEAAHGGTLFLDEIGDLPSEAQVKLLRVLQEGEIYRLGGNMKIKVDVRILAATNKDLDLLVTERKFRNDLYNRIDKFLIHVPPLRDRGDDTILLIAHFLKKHREKNRKENLEISHEAVEILKNRDWREGNIRSLENIIERLVILSDGRLIKPSDILKNAPEVKRFGNGSKRTDADARSLKIVSEDQKGEIKSRVLAALSKNSWNITKTAEELNTNRQRIYRMIARYNLRKLDFQYVGERNV